MLIDQIAGGMFATSRFVLTDWTKFSFQILPSEGMRVRASAGVRFGFSRLACWICCAVACFQKIECSAWTKYRSVSPFTPAVFPTDAATALGGNEFIHADDMRRFDNKDASAPNSLGRRPRRRHITIGKAPLVRVAEIGFRRVANDDHSASEIFQKRVEAVAEKTGDKGGVFYIAAQEMLAVD